MKIRLLPLHKDQLLWFRKKKSRILSLNLTSNTVLIVLLSDKLIYHEVLYPIYALCPIRIQGSSTLDVILWPISHFFSNAINVLPFLYCLIMFTYPLNT